MIYYPIFLMGTGIFMVATHWNGFFKENRDPDLLDYVRKRNESFFIGGIIGIAVAVLWLVILLILRAL